MQSLLVDQTSEFYTDHTTRSMKGKSIKAALGHATKSCREYRDSDHIFLNLLTLDTLEVDVAHIMSGHFSSSSSWGSQEHISAAWTTRTSVGWNEPPTLAIRNECTVLLLWHPKIM